MGAVPEAMYPGAQGCAGPQTRVFLPHEPSKDHVISAGAGLAAGLMRVGVRNGSGSSFSRTRRGWRNIDIHLHTTKLYIMK